MWPDNETNRDFLNFSGFADAVAETIVQQQSTPISIGVSGAWGVGKSSMLMLIQDALEQREESGKTKFVIVHFDAWLYQGYDDARAALFDVIARKLKKEAEKRKTKGEKAKEKATELLKRVDWFRVATVTGGSIAALSMGLAPVGLIGGVLELGKKALAGKANKDTAGELDDVVKASLSQAKTLIRPKDESSPPQEIREIRKLFEETLEELGVKLVVLIDDLDRCLPSTAISTLEAIRLFLFLKNTAFVIAADDAMIKNAVRQHFHGADDRQVTSYFDKLIQIPIRVPSLGTEEVRAYMAMLFVENSDMSETDKEDIRKKVCEQLAKSWQGEHVDRTFMASIKSDMPGHLTARFDMVDRLAPLMTTAADISGNPRLIKRFLNALSIRMAISKMHGVGLDEAIVAKMLLFERCGPPEAHRELIRIVSEDPKGKANDLKGWEDEVSEGNEPELKAPWDDDFVRKWLALPPRLGEVDLRGVLYVSREHFPLLTLEDRLSSAAAELLAAILKAPDMTGTLRDRLEQLNPSEISVMMDRVLDHARQEQDWGAPPILEACIVLSEVNPKEGERVAMFLQERPAVQVKPNIVPKIKDQPWASKVFQHWKTAGVSEPVKKAMSMPK